MVISPVALKVEEPPTEISAVAASVMSVPAVTVSAPVAAIWSRSMLFASTNVIDWPEAETEPVKSFASVSVIAFPALAIFVPPAMSRIVPVFWITAPAADTSKLPLSAAEPATTLWIVVSALAFVVTFPKVIAFASATETSPPVAANTLKSLPARERSMSKNVAPDCAVNVAVLATSTSSNWVMEPDAVTVRSSTSTWPNRIDVPRFTVAVCAVSERPLSRSCVASSSVIEPEAVNFA